MNQSVCDFCKSILHLEDQKFTITIKSSGSKLNFMNKGASAEVCVNCKNKLRDAIEKLKTEISRSK